MIYDIETKNKSFLKVSKTLKDRGVKNNKFMLALYDETLQGVDPRSKNLSYAQKLAIFKECSINIWYYIREVVTLPTDGAEIPYGLNLGNCTLTYLRERCKNFIIVLPRQHGKTIGEIVFETWNLLFATTNTTTLYLNKAKPDAVKNLKVFKDIKNLLPKWMLEDFIETPKMDLDNQEMKTIYKNNNTLKALSGGSDPDAADKAGRGLTAANIIFDEFAFLKYNDIVYKACLPAYQRASENAAKNGKPYGMILITTPNTKDKEGSPGKFCWDLIQDAAKWNTDCFDFTDHELDEFIQSNSKNNFIFVQYTYLELGRDEKWLNEVIRSMNNDTATVKREILLDWPRSQEGSVFSEDDLDKIAAFIRPPKMTIYGLNKRFPIYFYETPDFNLNYILSCDVSGGLSQDNSTIDIIHPEDFRIVGTFRNNKIDVPTFKDLLKELMTLYFRHSLLVVERNYCGIAILQDLMKDPIIEPRMYREYKMAAAEKKTVSGVVVKQKSKVLVYGVDTTAKSREQMHDILRQIVENEYDKIISQDLYDEIAGLEIRNGRVDHRVGGHDDSLMAYLVFRWAVTYGTCFRDKFGIYPSPSKINVRVVSSSENLSKIQTIIENANRAEASTNLNNSIWYNRLFEQDQRLKAQDTEKNDHATLLDNFLKWNK